MNDKLMKIIDKFKGKNVLVIGDVMLDKYVDGEVERISEGCEAAGEGPAHTGR